MVSGRSGAGALLVVSLLLATTGASAAGQAPLALHVEAYGGRSWTAASDLTLRVGQERLEIRRVRWEDESFESPIYYGLRLRVERADQPWSAVLDFTHAKVVADPTQEVDLEGSFGGAAVDGRRPLADVLEHLEMSHGYNVLTVGARRRWTPGGGDGRLGLHAAAGLGVLVPHVEVRVAGERTFRHQLTGPLARLGVGASVPLTDRMEAFTDYGWMVVRSRLELEGGNALHLTTHTHALNAGIAVRALGPPRDR